jgi:hypothetical protein
MSSPSASTRARKGPASGYAWRAAATSNSKTAELVRLPSRSRMLDSMSAFAVFPVVRALRIFSAAAMALSTATACASARERSCPWRAGCGAPPIQTGSCVRASLKDGGRIARSWPQGHRHRSDVAVRLALAPFKLSELMKSLEPIGIDRWAVEQDLKHGILDLFGCPSLNLSASVQRVQSGVAIGPNLWMVDGRHGEQ